jgi:replicative DNA helicase
VTLLRLLKYRRRYEKLIRAVPKHALDIRTATILDDFGKYFKEYETEDKACTDEFYTWFNLAHPTLKDEQRELYRNLFKQAAVDVSEQIEAGLMDRLVAADAASKLTDALMKYSEGDEIDLHATTKSIVDQWDLDRNRKVRTPWIQDDINELLKDDEQDKGFHWRLDALNLVMRPLRWGDFGIVAARPDVGKTTLLASEVTYMASQLPNMFTKEEIEANGEPVIAWFNNEGPGNRIVKRLYQAALNATNDELIALSKTGSLKDKYAKAIGGSATNIRVFDVHDFWNHEIEDILRTFNVVGIVFDMVDNVQFGGSANNNGQRTDQLLEAMYQWARVIGVKHQCWVIACSQVSADGENLCYPTLSMLKDSKTGKQGAADFILTVGYNPEYSTTRFLGLTKNKLHRTGAPKQLKAEAIFDGERSRYVDANSPTGAVQ